MWEPQGLRREPGNAGLYASYGGRYGGDRELTRNLSTMQKEGPPGANEN